MVFESANRHRTYVTFQFRQYHKQGILRPDSNAELLSARLKLVECRKRRMGVFTENEGGWMVGEYKKKPAL